MSFPISDVKRRVVYSGSAGTGPYSFSFEILANTDIDVYKNSTLLTLTTDYTVFIDTDGTGSVTLVAAATGADNITLVGARSIERSTDFVTGGDLFANTLNQELDSVVIFAQQIDEKADRGLKAPITDPTDINMQLPVKASRRGKVLAFDETSGDPVAGPDLSAMTTVIAQSANINTVAANIASVNTVAGNTSNINTVSGISGNVTTVAGISSNVTTVAGIAANVTTVAGNTTNINTVAGISANVTTVAGLSSDITTVVANIVDIQNAEENADAAIAAKVAAETARDQTLAAFDSFDDRYLGTKTADPTLDNDGNALVAGALYFNSVSGIMKVYTGTVWVAAYVQGIASDIAFTPAGNIAAVNVQAAIQELDTEKVGKTSNTGSALIPSGTDAQRDGSPAAGFFRFNTTLNQFEGYNGTAWGAVGGGATGGAGNAAFYENDTNVTVNYTITSGKNAMTAGPITIDNGVTVTVPNGSTWTVV